MQKLTKSQINNLVNIKYDVLVIGGGATGSAIALDSINRGFSTILLEQADYAQGTSSKSTKILHGGVRYLAQGNIKLVYHALKEKIRLYKNAPHIAYSLNFIIPNNSVFLQVFYGFGMLIYDILAGFNFKYLSKWFLKSTVVKFLPNLNDQHNKYGIQYNDGQFDDARLNITVIQTFVQQGGIALNYCKVIEFIKVNNKIIGVKAFHEQLNITLEITANVIFNATGIFSDTVNNLDGNNLDNITLAQGIHLVVNNNVYNSNKAMLIPKTNDNRVLFCIPWYNKVIVGTTDTLVKEVTLHPIPLQSEINLIIENFNNYLKLPLDKKDITSIYAGIRPLIKNNSATSKISREQKITISNSGLISIIGGKWTTFRHMGELAINFAIKHKLLPKKPCNTYNLKLYGYLTEDEVKNIPFEEKTYGSNYIKLKEINGFGIKLHQDLPICKAKIIWAIDNEMAETVEDILARRTRCLFLNAKASIEIAPIVAKIMQEHLAKDEEWFNKQISNFNKVANLYLPSNYL